MKICVLVKQVPDKNDQIKLNSENSSIDKSNFNFVTNESDNYAIEEALLIKEKLQGEVVVCSFGNESSVQVIKDAGYDVSLLFILQNDKLTKFGTDKLGILQPIAFNLTSDRSN